MGSNVTEKALNMLKYLPRVCLANIRRSPNTKHGHKRGRAQHGGDKHGCGNKGSGQRQNYMRLGYETGNNPFYLRFGFEPYYLKHHLRREYPPLSMLELLKLIELNRIDNTKPIDLLSILNTGCYKILPDQRQYGVQLTDEGADLFNVKVNIEVQYASEIVIAAIERMGGVITTAFYDMHSLQCMLNTKKFFERGIPIPRRMMPPRDAIEYYSDPKMRGYLADPAKVNEERIVLAQKYGYELPVVEKDKDYEMLNEKKDPRQIFYGLHPGWVVNLKDKVILKPETEELQRYYAT